MSGHSKWATTKRAKAVVDAKRAGIFTKYANAITIAAREKGGDPETNFSLRLAVDKARGVNMPKENIERAVKRGLGVLEGETLEEIRYEGFGPDGVALMIDVLTNSRNRCAQEMKHLFSKHGGNLGAQGSVAWMFLHRGVIVLSSALTENAQLELMEMPGIEDISVHDEKTAILCLPETMQEIRSALSAKNIPPESAELDYIPKNSVECTDAAREKLDRLFEELDSMADITDYYSTAS